MCHVREYLQVIRDTSITLNLEKCYFGKPEVKTRGSHCGIRVQEG